MLGLTDKLKRRIMKKYNNYLDELIDYYKNTDFSKNPPLRQTLDILSDNDTIFILTKSLKMISMWDSVGGWYPLTNDEERFMDNKIITVVGSEFGTVYVVLDYDE